MKTQLNISNKTCKTLAFILSFLLIFEQSGFAQVAAQLGIPGQIAALQGYIVPDAFRPLHLRYLEYDTLNNNFQLFLDKGSLKDPKPEEVKDTTKQLLNYFSVGLALPSESFWVNLRPDGEDNIIDPDLAKTDLGRVMLEADLQLKKDTARFTSPETPQGKTYWDKLYKKAENLFGSDNVTIPTLTRVWILPHEIILSENKSSAYIRKATLRVLLEKDYLKDSSTYEFNDPKLKELNEYSSQLFRELIIPKLTKDVNAARRYAPLRQVYYSLIMAQWFKARFANKKGLSPKGTLPDLIDTRNLTGLTSKASWSTTTYFKAYQKSVNEGEYNIHQNQDAPFTSYHQTTKSYFSGGVIANCDIPALGGATFTNFDPATKTGTSVTSVPTSANTAVNPNRGVGVEVDALGEVNITQAPPAAQGPEVNSGQAGKGSEGSKDIILGSGPAEWFVRKFGHVDLGKAIANRFKKKSPPSPVEVPASLEPAFNIKESPEAVDYSVGSFRGVDLEHFVHAQTRLSKKELPVEDLRRILIKLGLTPDLTEDLAYRKIYEELAKGRYNKEIIDIINGFDPKRGASTYTNPRLGVTIIDQNANPRAQGIYEAVANGLDALGFKIGQFGKGVKQIIDWLEESSGDRIDVYTRKENAKAYQLTILKGKSGQEYIQVVEIPVERFQEIAKEAGAEEFDKGTVLRVATRKEIPRDNSQLDATRHNSLQEIADGIHKRFPFVTAVAIDTRIGSEKPEKVNGFKEKVVVVPPGQAPYSPEESAGRSIHVQLNTHDITVVDNGIGMSAEIISGMFVPKAGTKKPEFLSGEAAERELSKIKVVHDSSLPHRISFARNGEVISAIDIPQDIHSDASVPGGLMVEFGLLLDVPESRDNVILPQARPREETGFQKAIMHAVKQIASHPRLSAKDKATYINTIVIGLDGLTQGNENNSNVIKNIRALIQESLAPVIEELKKEGFIILPHDNQFGKLRFPEDKKDKVLFIHEGLFNWQGAVSLKEVGAEVIPLIRVGGEKRLPLLVVPFSPEHLKGISRFDRLWHTWRQSDRIAIIKTDRFVALPQELGARLKELAQKKIARGLDKKEEKEFASLTQLIKIITAEEVVTSYEVAVTKEDLTIEEIKFERSRGQVDSDAINDFLTQPPVTTKLGRGAEAAYLAKSAADEGFELIRNAIDSEAEDSSTFSRRSSLIKELVEALVKIGRIDEATQVLERERIEDNNYKSEAYLLLADALAKENRKDEALSLIQKATEIIEHAADKDKKNLYYRAIRLSAELKFSWAMKTFISTLPPVNSSLPTDYRYSSKCLLAMAEAISRLLVEDASKLAFEALDGARNIEDTEEGRSEKFSLMRGTAELFGRMGKAKEALQVLEEIKSYPEAKPIAIIFAARGLAKSGKATDAYDFAKRALEAAKSVTDKSYKFQELRDIVELLAELGLSDEALQVAQEIEDNTWKSSAFILVAKALAGLGKAEYKERAASVAKMAIQQVPEDSEEKEGGFILLQNIEAAKLLVELGKVEEALQIAEETRGDIWKSLILAYIATAFVKSDTAEAKERALSIGRRALQLARGTTYEKNSKADSSTWDVERQVVGLFVKLGKTDEGLEAAEEIKDSIRKTIAFIDIGMILAKSGMPEQAVSVAKRVLQAERETDSVSLMTIESLVGILEYSTEADEAVSLAKDILEATRSSKASFILGDKTTKVKIFLNVSGALKKIASQEAPVAGGIKKAEISRPNILFEEAMNAARNISDDYLRKGEVLLQLAWVMAAEKGLEKTKGLFQDVLSLCEHLTTINLNVQKDISDPTVKKELLIHEAERLLLLAQAEVGLGGSGWAQEFDSAVEYIRKADLPLPLLRANLLTRAAEGLSLTHRQDFADELLSEARLLMLRNEALEEWQLKDAVSLLNILGNRGRGNEEATQLLFRRTAELIDKINREAGVNKEAGSSALAYECIKFIRALTKSSIWKNETLGNILDSLGQDMGNIYYLPLAKLYALTYFSKNKSAVAARIIAVTLETIKDMEKIEGPYRPVALAEAANILLELGYKEKAEEWFKRALELIPDSVDSIKAETLIQFAKSPLAKELASPEAQKQKAASEAIKEEEIGKEEVLQMAEVLEENISNLDFIDALNEALLRMGKKDLRIAFTSPIRFFPLYFLVGTLIDYLTADIGDIVKGYFQVSNKEIIKSGKKGIVNLLAQALAEESEGPIPLELLLGKTQTVAGNLTFGQLRLESLSYVLTALAEAGKIDMATAEEVFTAERPTMGTAVTDDRLPEAVVKALEKAEKERRASPGPAVQGPVLFSDTKPDDAPNRFVIMLDAIGVPYIRDTKADMPDDALYEVVRRITLDDGNEAFIGYHANGEFDIYAADSTFFRSGSTSASFVANKGKLVVIERADQNGFKHQSVFDVSSGKYAPSIAENPSLKVSLSASGRFSVHQEADGKLVYYDHAPGKTLERKVILDTTFNSYRVDTKADVVVVESPQGVYSLFNLARGVWVPVEVDHIEIDSTGQVAIWKEGDELGYAWINYDDEGGHSSGDWDKIRVSFDDKYTYLIAFDKSGNIKKSVQVERGGSRNAGPFFVQENLLPPFGMSPGSKEWKTFVPMRYWEEYGLQEKTIWDREINRIPAPSVPAEEIELPYFSNSPTGLLEKSITLNGNTALYFDERQGGKAVLMDLDNNREKTLFNAKEMAPLEGGKVWYKTTFANDDIVEVLMIKEGGIEAIGSITQDRFFVSQPKKFLLRENKNGFSLIDNNGNQIDITRQIPAGYECSDVNGEYFVFVNPQTSQVKYLDPSKAFAQAPAQEAGATPEEIQREQEEIRKTMESWKENVLSKRDALIAKVQAAYKPFLSLAPEEFRGEIEKALKVKINKLYAEQDNELKKRFQESRANAEGIKLEHLAFDHFAGQMSRTNPLLQEYTKSLSRRLSQEPYQAQKEAWLSVFTALFELSVNTNLAVESIDSTFLEVLSYGWDIGAQEAINAIGLISNVINSLKENNPNIGIAQTRKIVEFFSNFCSKNQAVNIPVLEGQLVKILNLKPDARRAYLEKMVDAFKGVEKNLLNEYLRNPAASSNLGKAREFVVFLTNKVEQLKIKERRVPQGRQRIPGGHKGVSITQIMQLEEQRKRVASDKETVMSVGDLITAVENNNLPRPSEESEAKILLDTKVQRESGAYTAEITQNSKDATRGKAGELIVDYYLQKNADGVQEYVEEAADNGTGALYEVALLIPKSTKASGEQKELTGFFGTGKYTVFEGVDRVEIISKNSERAYMFTFIINRDASGNPVEIKLTGILEINDPDVSQGVTVRRIKGITNSIPELDQMLAQRAWKTFAGLTQNENFTISFIDHEGKKQPLTVKKELLAEADFKAFERGKEAETNFGKMRIFGTEDMPLQIVDKAGLRVGELKEEYLALIPSGLRKHIQELGVIIQIPLPLIRNRSAFEHENEYLPIIQKYVATQFYRAIAYKALTETSPQFVFEGFSLDWETNDDYWGSIDLGDKEVVELADKINFGDFSAITENELKTLLTEKGRLDKGKRFVKLMLLLNVDTGKDKQESLVLRRLAIQMERNRRRAEAQAELLRRAGMRVKSEDIPDLSNIPQVQKKLMQAKGIETAHEQMRHIKDFLVDPKDYTDSERELIDLARPIARQFGLENVVLVDSSVSFAGGFISMDGKNLMAINRTLAHDIGRARGAHIDAATDTVVHELGHLLERLMRQDDPGEVLENGYVAHTSNFTHDSVGTFAEAMKYVAAVTLMNDRRIMARSEDVDDNFSETAGALKDIGDDDAVEVSAETSNAWRKASASEAVETRVIKDLEIKAKFITDKDNKMPQGMSAYHLYDNVGNLIIVTRSGINPDLIDEAIYHEAREAAWIRELITRAGPQAEEQKQEILHKAHILASAEQSLAFTQGGGQLTPYHQSQLDGMPRNRLQRIIKESREYQHGVIRDYLGEGIIAKIQEYESRLKTMAAEQIEKSPDVSNTGLRPLSEKGKEVIEGFKKSFSDTAGVNMLPLIMGLAVRGLEVQDLYGSYDDEYDVIEVRDEVIPIIANVTGMERALAFNFKGFIVVPESLLRRAKGGNKEAQVAIKHEKRHNDYRAVHGEADKFSVEQRLIDELYAYFASFAEIYGTEALNEELQTEAGKGIWSMVVAAAINNDYINGAYKDLTSEKEKESQKIMVYVSSWIIHSLIKTYGLDFTLKYLKSVDNLKETALLSKTYEGYLSIFEHFREQLNSTQRSISEEEYSISIKKFAEFKDAYFAQKEKGQTAPIRLSQNPPTQPGGIDFRTLPIVIQSVSNLSANIRNSPVNINKLSSINLNREWEEIEDLVNSGVIPQAEKIKEYIQASCCNQSIGKNIDKVILVISDILRLEEELYVETEPALKDILVVLESASSVQELRAVFIGNS